MCCPECGEREFGTVIDSRVSADGTYVRRLRCCRSCGNRDRTIEVTRLTMTPIGAGIHRMRRLHRRIHKEMVALRQQSTLWDFDKHRARKKGLPLSKDDTE